MTAAVESGNGRGGRLSTYIAVHPGVLKYDAQNEFSQRRVPIEYQGGYGSIKDMSTDK